MAKQGERIQTEVLAILSRQRGALSAYEVLGVLNGAHPKIAPQTVYRALAALTKRGQVHRLESLNAFIACRCDQHLHATILSICDDCGAVEENVAPDLLRDVSEVVGRSGFAPKRHVIEVHGRCASCGTGNALA